MSSWNGWTPERRAKQALAIRQSQPWTKSTGPRTPEGKARSARNGRLAGLHKELYRLNKVLRLLAAQLEEYQKVRQ